MRISAEQIQSRLEEQGLTFSLLTLSHTGQYSEHDADWNYKDIPHLNEVHKMVDGVPVVIEHDLISNYFLQRVGPFRIPLSVTNYSASSNSQVYFTSAFLFVLIVETNWISHDKTATSVTTTYRIGSQRLLKPIHRLIARILQKNYNTLMVEDIPMRSQRGKLRERGISFRGDLSGYSFLETLNLHVDNIIIPSEGDLVETLVSIEDIRNASGLHCSGTDDHRGVQLKEMGGTIWAFPRICPHEGAPLDDVCSSDADTGSIRCPWHGRRIRGVEITSDEEMTILNCRISRNDSEVRIRSR